MKDLVIVGVGGHGREILQCVADINAREMQWNVLGFVDDGSALTQVSGLPMLGPAGWLRNRDCSVIVAIGAPAVRRRVVRTLMDMGGVKFATLVHPSALIGAQVMIGEGSMICANAVLTTDIVVGRHVIVNTSAVVSHDCHLADFVSIGPNACLCGAVQVGEGAELGAACTLVPGIHLGVWSAVGAGATVINEVAAHVTVAGVPARAISSRLAGWQDYNDK